MSIVKINLSSNYAWKQGEHYFLDKVYLQEMKDFFGNLKESEINTSGKVYFAENAIFPRNQFSKIYMNEKTQSAESAEYVVLNFQKVKNETDYIHTSKILEFSDGTFAHAGYNNTASRVVKTMEGLCVNNVNHWQLENFRLFEKIKDKKIVADTSLFGKFTGQKEFSAEAFKKVNRLLKSGDKINVKIAMAIISKMDINSNLAKIALLVNRYFNTVSKYGTRTVDKSLVNYLLTKFPSISDKDGLKFYLTLLNYDSGISELADIIFQSILPTKDKKYKLELVDI